MSTARSRVSACCNVGQLVPRWQNITKVRPAGDSPAGTPHYTSAPYLRTPIPCVGSPAGTCGFWVGGTNAPFGDFTGLSDQVIDGIVDDIMPPGATDATHFSADHNYFFKNGDTVNMVMAKRSGGQWVTAQKHWYGCPPLTDPDTCNLLPTNTPNGTRYRTATFAATYSNTVVSTLTGYNASGGASSSVQTVVTSGGTSGARSIGQYDGMFRSTLVVTNGQTYGFSSDLWGDTGSNFNRSTTYLSSNIGSLEFTDTNLNRQIMSGIVGGGSSGTTAATAPAWNTACGGYTTDGTIIWLNIGTRQVAKAGTYTILNASNSAGTSVAQTLFAASADLSTYSTPLTGYNVGASLVGADVNTDVHCATDIPSVAAQLAFCATTAVSQYGVFGSYTTTAITNGTHYHTTSTASGASTVSTFDVYVTRTATVYTVTATIRIYNHVGGADVLVYSLDYSFTVTLSDAYTAAQCLTDYNALHQQQDMSDFTVASLRTDEQLANVQLLIYDEVPIIRSPLGAYPFDQTDYSNPLNDVNGNAPWTAASGNNGTALPLLDGDGSINYPPSPTDDVDSGGAHPVGCSAWLASPRYDGVPVKWIPTFGTMLYTDHYGSSWRFDGKQTMPDWVGSSASWTTAVLKTPLWSGNPITHNLAGSDANFWFGYPKMNRYFDSGSAHILWQVIGYGSTPELTLGSSSPIANTALRWMNKFQSQYDPWQWNGGTGVPVPPGNYSHGWQRHIGGVLTGGKYVEAATNWPAVNYGCPAGAGDGTVGTGRYAIDQTTVCCKVSGSAPNFVIKPTTNAIAPLATGGLQIGDYIVVETVGVFKITNLVASGGNWNLTVGSIIDTLATGWNFTDPQQVNNTDGTSHIGRLRWVNYTVGGVNKTSAPGIFGRAACTATWASGTVTLTTTTAQAYLRPDPVNGSISVDIYDATMTLLSAAVNLTRVSDTVFTFSSGSAMPTAAFIVCAGVDWTAAMPSWVALTYFNAGQMIYDSAGNLQRCTTAGQSGATSPTWATSGTTTDGAVVWTFVQLAKSGIVANWTFDQRGAAKLPANQPAWLGGTGAGVGDGEKGCLASGYQTTQFNFAANSCPTMVGLVPFYGGTPAPLETFTPQQLFPIPNLTPDDPYGAFSLNRIELTMVNPFWQQPYKPTCNISTSFAWTEDDGTGQADAPTGSPPKLFYAHRPWVMAAKTIPTGWALPDVLNLTWDTTKQTVDPPFYVYGAAGYITGGIPVGDTSLAGDGSYANIETNWGFQAKACATIAAATSPFAAAYQKFVSC